MSEKIQIVFEVSRDPDSKRVLKCQRAPKMSVPDAAGDMPDEFFSKVEASWCRARFRSSVKTPRDSGVQPLTTSRMPPKESTEMVDTQTRLLAGSLSKSVLVEVRYALKRSLGAPFLPTEPLTSIRMPS